MDISGKLRQVNGRLKASRVGVSVEQNGGRLRLRATLPPRPGSTKKEPHQQRLPTGQPANPAGLRQAEKLARLVGSQLAVGEFTWADWLGTDGGKTGTVGEAIANFEAEYLAAGGNPETWKGDYQKVLKKLPPDATLTGELLEAFVSAIPPTKKTRRRASMAAGALAKFAGVEFNAARLRGSYSPAAVSPRELPTDAQIVDKWASLTNPAWRWVFGMMATYGLRNHEVFRLDLEAFPRVRVLETTKTGGREVWPCFPEWVEQWELATVQLPPVDATRSNLKVGHSVTAYLSPLMPFKPYDLRHAWAVRTLLFGWPVELSARQMGHSVEIHTRTYQRWITGQQIQQVYELLVNRPDRPRPPAQPSAQGDTR